MSLNLFLEQRLMYKLSFRFIGATLILF